MGLDMYLNKVKKEEIAYWRKANAIHAWFERHLTDDEKGIENCRSYYVDKSLLQKLKRDCKTVLKSSELVYKDVPVKEYDYDQKQYVTVTKHLKVLDDPKVAEELLPTQSGFFFGSTEYDEGYVEELKSTIEQIDEVLNTVDFDEYDVEYHAWW